MNWLDLAIIISLTIGGIVGWHHGFSKVVAVVIGIVLGVYLAGRFGASAGEALTFIENARLAAVVGYGVVFAGVFVALMIAAQAVRKSLGMVLLGWVDRAGGAVLGLAAGVIVWYGIVTAAAALPFESIDDTIEKSDVAMFMSERVAVRPGTPAGGVPRIVRPVGQDPQGRHGPGIHSQRGGEPP